MRDLFRFLFRQRNNMLFLALIGLSMSMVIGGNMHQRARMISSSNAVIGRVMQWRSGITEFTDLRRVNRALAEELARERERAYATTATHDSTTLFVDTVRHLRYRFITAQVINSTVHKEKNYLTLDKGSADGIAPDMGVMGTSGIVGVVKDVSPHFALVTSVLNSDHTIGVLLKNTKHFGQLRWDRNTNDPHTADLSDVDKHVPVHKGDTVVTRGSDRAVYPAGVMVGVVDTVINDPGIPFHTIVLRLSEDMTRADYVHVVNDLMRPERDSLETKAGQE